MKQLFYQTINGNKLGFCLWHPGKDVLGIVQMVHDENQSNNQYDDIANFFNANGYVVCEAKYNNVYPNNLLSAINDEIFLAQFLKSKYNVPLFLLGCGYDDMFMQKILEQTKLFNGVVCVPGINRENTVKNINGNIMNVLRKILGYKFHSLAFGNLKRFKCNWCPGRPLLYIVDQDNIVTANTRLIKTLYNATPEDNLENLKFVIYPEMKSNVPIKEKFKIFKTDILDFFNTNKTSPN